MKTCKGCKYAGWDRTKSYRLHPSGKGICAYPYRVPPLPGAFFWLGQQDGEPHRPSGGYIHRRELLKRDCPYWTREG